MVITYVKTKVINPQKPDKNITKDFMVDSGATYSVVPEQYLKKIGIKPHRKMDFILADGTKLTREIGDAIYELEGERGAAPVIFGKKGDSLLFGAVTLEALGLVLDPFKRELRPMKMMLV